MAELVTRLSQVITNIENYNPRSAMRQRLKLHRCWYYIPALKKFGPSKFIGYKNMTPRQYFANFNVDMDGRESEPELHQWFRKVSDNTYARYYRRLELFLPDLPRRVVKIFILK